MLYYLMNFHNFLWSIVNVIISHVCRANLLSESEIIKFNIEVETHEIPDARTYLLKLKEMRVKYAF